MRPEVSSRYRAAMLKRGGSQWLDEESPPPLPRDLNPRLCISRAQRYDSPSSLHFTFNNCF